MERPDGFDPGAVREAIGGAFGPVDALHSTLIDLGPGEGMAEVLGEGAEGGFLLDLDPPEWRSEWGGLLLFQDAGGQRLHGYRPVSGALTLFAASARPLISLVMLGAPARISLCGWWGR